MSSDVVYFSRDLLTSWIKPMVHKSDIQAFLPYMHFLISHITIQNLNTQIWERQNGMESFPLMALLAENLHSYKMESLDRKLAIKYTYMQHTD